MGTTTINISMPDSLKLKVEEAMESDGYGNTSEFFRDLARDYIKRRQEKKLEEMLLEGLQSGSSPLKKGDIEAIKQRAFKRLEEERR
ncbi:MAG TPA: ribbon-helix-helix domain-containing protein [Pyrinomonadaceae bacterium]